MSKWRDNNMQSVIFFCWNFQETVPKRYHLNTPLPLLFLFSFLSARSCRSFFSFICLLSPLCFINVTEIYSCLDLLLKKKSLIKRSLQKSANRKHDWFVWQIKCGNVFLYSTFHIHRGSWAKCSIIFIFKQLYQT